MDFSSIFALFSSMQKEVIVVGTIGFFFLQRDSQQVGSNGGLDDLIIFNFLFFVYLDEAPPFPYLSLMRSMKAYLLDMESFLL